MKPIPKLNGPVRNSYSYENNRNLHQNNNFNRNGPSAHEKAKNYYNQIRNDPPQNYNNLYKKDPDVWDPPPPPNHHQKPRNNNNHINNKKIEKPKFPRQKSGENNKYKKDFSGLGELRKKQKEEEK